MMTFLIVLLTIVLIVNSLFLALLILIQLPKKEAGVGVAFGGGATDALFGAGSGNALTKLTKYSAAIFFCVVIILSSLNTVAKNSAGSKLQQQLKQTPAAPISTTPAAPATPASNVKATPAPASNASSATNLLQIAPMTAPTNSVPGNTAPAPSAASNAPAAPAK